jgi:hypothetical protein
LAEEILCEHKKRLKNSKSTGTASKNKIDAGSITFKSSALWEIAFGLPEFTLD